MKRMGMTPGKSANTDPRIRLARQSKTMQSTRFTISGRERSAGRQGPKPVTIKRLAFLDRKDPE